jgi:putative membrane protein insertion efficiency factor
VRPPETSSEKFSARATGQWLLLAFVHLYRVFLSPFLGGACKFYPSCSQYAQEAIALHGAKRGSWLALKRLGRCRPFTKGGFDPVPGSSLGYEECVSCAVDTAGDGRRETGLVAASRDFHDYSDAEWLRSVNKELVQ